ncbi:PRAME family member 8-like [Mesocricetus auratus]|uniref:PRAME family member 8-like n=1 Tax=Mesocricetus auratus TaxID=10036 RepID=A0ABM2XM37_MESAU|nr:PRAME family member 8-like [Mesocricetus auratus]
MGARTPPTLEELARQALLKNEALTISALEQLPKMLFIALSQKALRKALNSEGLRGWEMVAVGIRTPWKQSITHCKLYQTNLYHLSQCHHLCQLKHLDMSGVLLSNFFLMPLRVLLEKVVDTLESLELEGCGIKDSQLSFFLPVLRQCSKLTKVNFYTNDFSMNVLSDLLHHTANLSKMTMEQYPAPQECYELGVVSIERFVQVCPVLMDTLRAIRQPKSISFATDVCSRCSKRCVYEQETRLCSCLQ